jgi:serine/threonine protein kinase
MPGLQNIANLLDFVDEIKDLWLIYEVGSQSLSSLLFHVKGEFYKGERIYNVAHKDFYECLRKSSQVLKDFIKKLAECFEVLSAINVIHADIKPDNILVGIEDNRISSFKLIDFGSAFYSDQPSHIAATTPEYLAPEVLDFIENRN